MEQRMLMTPAGELTVAQAEPADLHLVAAILEDAARWLHSRGIDMWPLTLPRPPLEDAIRRREVYLARLGDQIAGTFRLQWSDTAIWGEQPPDAGYVHALAIHRSHAGKELGAYILDCAAAIIATTDRSVLRLDCMADNPALCAYYQRLGFKSRGRIEGAGWSAQRYERTSLVET